MRVSIIDVARSAGVSKSTVSRVLTGGAGVRPATRARVEATMRAMGYRPNGLARGLVSGRTQTIGLIVFELHNPFFGLLAQGVEVAARSYGYNVLICSSHDSMVQQQECLSMLAERRVDGVLIVPIQSDEADIGAIRQTGLTVVLLNSVAGNDRVSSVGVDHARGGYLVTRHLLNLGHRRISFIGHPVGYRGRLHGYQLAHKEQDVALDERLVCTALVDTDIETVHAAVSGLLAMPEPPTAIFTLNDEIAIATLQALAQRGVQVPEDIAVVGYDDIPVAARLAPPLTTVAQPKEEQGRIATELLINTITNPATPVQRIVLQPRLMVRQSCGAGRPGSPS